MFDWLVNLSAIFVFNILGFEKGSIMYIVIGNSFAWEDILCYFAGCVLLYIFVKFKK